MYTRNGHAIQAREAAEDRARMRPPALPGWADMSDLDKGCALLHLHKRLWEGSEYAVEHYPAQYREDPRLTALDGEAASRHAASMRGEANLLDGDEWNRLYDMAGADR